MSLIDNSSSSSMGMGVGNYKGVMLCNRPFGGSAVENKPKATGEKAQFHCGVVPEVPGLPQPVSQKEKFLRRPKKDSVLTKHKKWLADLQKTKEQLELQYLEELKSKEDSSIKFQEHEKKMRGLSITMIREAGDKSPSNNQSSDEKNSYKSIIAESKAGGSSSDDAKAQAKGFSGEKKSYKPAWAMTEEAADSSLEKMARDAEQAEEDELMDFVKDLDYDKYMADVEVQTMMERLRKRIGDLEKEVKVEDERESAAGERQAKREFLELMSATEGALQGKTSFGDASEEERAAMLAARQLLQEDEDMQAIHSTKSMAKLLVAAKEKISEVTTSVKTNMVGQQELEPQVYNEPKIVVHDSDGGARLEGKTAIRNLPYMNRNPAV